MSNGTFIIYTSVTDTDSEKAERRQFAVNAATNTPDIYVRAKPWDSSWGTWESLNFAKKEHLTQRLTDCNTISKGEGFTIGIYMVDGLSQNAPTITFGILFNLGYNTAYACQYIMSNTGIWHRVYNNYIWEDWIKVV